MCNFWDNLYKFPRFLIAVIIGFFLTTFEPLFRLLTDKKKQILFINIIGVISVFFYLLLKLMLGIN